MAVTIHEAGGDFKQKKKRNKRKILRRSQVAWPEVMEFYITGNLLAQGGKPLTLKAVSIRFGLNEGTVRNKASAGDWSGQLRQRRVEVNDQVSAKLLEHTIVNIKAVQLQPNNSEVEVRGRHATLGRAMQAKAALRLRNLDSSQLTARDAIALMKLGIEQEAKALGLSSRVSGGTPLDGSSEDFTIDDADSVLAEIMQIMQEGDSGTPALEQLEHILPSDVEEYKKH